MTRGRASNADRTGAEEIRSEDVSIIGLGASGHAAARLALHKGETVYVSDLSTDAGLAAGARDLEALGAHVDLGHHDTERIASARVVVVSPGIPHDAPVLRELRDRGVRWISEPDFAVRFHQGSLIAVTGTNGKTTTCALIAHVLEAAGMSVGLGGNVGGGIAPAASELALARPPAEWWVLEMSSFQLADTVDFSPDIGVVTNLAPDHLDRYSTVDAYYRDKARLFQNAGSSSRWVLNRDDPATVALAGDASGRRYLFALEPGDAVSSGTVDAGGRAVGAGSSGGAESPGGAESLGGAELDRPSAYVRDGMLALRLNADGEGAASEERLLPRVELHLLGQHNVRNALAAALTARLAGARADGIREGLRSFEPLPHRLQPVTERSGVLWVNDSKATNVAATRSAVASLDRPVVLLLGGKDKGEDFRPLAAALRGRARAVIVYGEARPRIARELSEGWSEVPREADVGAGRPPVLVTVDEGFDAAVRVAGSMARAGDIVLLAPACSSFDLFDGYAERGRRFEQLVRRGGS